MPKINLKTKLFGFTLVICATALIGAFAMSSAFAQDDQDYTAGKSEGTTTRIAETNLYLTGDRAAVAGTDYMYVSDGQIVVTTDNWTLSGDAAESSGKTDIIFANCNKLTLQNLTAVDFYVAISEKKTGNYDISIEGDNPIKIDYVQIVQAGVGTSKEFDSSTYYTTFSGSGTLKASRIMCTFGELTLNGPTIYCDGHVVPRKNNNLDTIKPALNINQEPNKTPACVVSQDNIYCKEGTLIADTNTEEIGIIIVWGKSLHISDNFELFANGNKTSIALEKADPSDPWGTIDCSTDSLKGNISQISYAKKDSGDWKNVALNEFISITTLTLFIDGSSNMAKTAYHKTIKPELESIAVASLPVKTEYALGETFDKTGLTITKTYNDGTTEEAVPEDSEISGFDSSTPGEKTVTVTCSDSLESNAAVSTSFTVTVKDSANADSAASGSTQTGDFNFALIAFLLTLILGSGLYALKVRKSN